MLTAAGGDGSALAAVGNDGGGGVQPAGFGVLLDGGVSARVAYRDNQPSHEFGVQSLRNTIPSAGLTG